MLSTQLKNSNQIGSFPHKESKIKNLLNHLDIPRYTWFATSKPSFVVESRPPKKHCTMHWYYAAVVHLSPPSAMRNGELGNLWQVKSALKSPPKIHMKIIKIHLKSSNYGYILTNHISIIICESSQITLWIISPQPLDPTGHRPPGHAFTASRPQTMMLRPT